MSNIHSLASAFSRVITASMPETAALTKYNDCLSSLFSELFPNETAELCEKIETKLKRVKEVRLACMRPQSHVKLKC